MTTVEPWTVGRPPGVARAGDTNLQARMWIGRNPLLFVAVCLTVGYLFGRAVKR